MFISMDATLVRIRNVHRLARPQRRVIEESLHEGGLSEAEAERIARDSGRSVPVLRRQLFQANAVSPPAWANPETARTLFPVLLANAWDERRDGDREVIETLSGKSYEPFVRELSPLVARFARCHANLVANDQDMGERFAARSWTQTEPTADPHWLPRQAHRSQRELR